MPKPLICAHAGGADLGPANSIEAARASLLHLNPQDLIEIDLQQTADGELVLIHGGILDSIKFALGQTSSIRNTTLKDLRDQAPQIATLEEMLRAINGQCGIVLDVKDPHIPMGLLGEIVEARHTNEIYLTAANQSVLERAKREKSNWKRVAQCRTATRDQIETSIQRCSPQVIDIWPINLSEARIKYVKSRGLEFVPGGMVWPFSRLGENPDNIKRWAKEGALYVVTFNPRTTKEILKTP